MSWSLRRASGVVLGVATLAAIAFLQTAWSQPLPGVPVALQEKPQPPGQPTGDLPDPSENLTFKKDNDKAAKIQAAEDYIATEDWKQATELLQQLLQLEADVFAQLSRKDAEGKVTKVWTSVRGEAKRLVSTLPKPGMEFYKVTYGQSANDQLIKAQETGDPTYLADVMRRFLYTDAGGEATTLLATYYLDRGDYTAAGLCFKRLIERDGLGKIDKNVLFKAAYAFHQIADQKAEDDVWKELGSRGGAVRLGDRNHNVADLQKFVGGLVRMVSEYNRTTWPIFGGNSNRNGKAEGDTAFMEPRWRQPLTTFDTSRDRIKQATDHQVEKQLPLLSSFHPVTATINRDGQKLPVVLYRGYDGLHAYHLKTGQRLWMAPSGLSLDGLFRSAFKVGYITTALDQYLGSQKLRPTILFDNSTTGTVSSDNNMVFVIDDVAVPPPPTFPGGAVRPPVGNPPGGMDDINNGNKLQAWSLATGKLRWVQGTRDDHGAADLRDTYFLGPPLPVAGRLYVLVEKQQDLKLAELDAVTGKLLRLQPLAETKVKLQQDINRRIHAAHLAAGEGMLICPTNAGAVLCIDLLENSLVWAYSYGEVKPVEPGVGPGRPFRPGFPPGIGPDGRPLARPIENSWRNTAPIIQGGKVYFAAPDSQALHCVNLVDGSRVWTHRRTDDDLFLGGVFNGKVLVVGRRSVRALDALKGTQLWSVATGQPSGTGVCSDNLYYLPLREGVDSKDPEIVAIDLERGAVHAHTKSRKKEIPGNLVFFDGDVISQSTSEIAVFPQLRVKLAQIDERIKIDPNDPIGLVERGELRLDKGDLQGAVEDLNRALQQPSIPKELVGKAREKLFETLTDFLQRDFNGAEKYLETYEALCKVDVPADATPEVKAEKEGEARRRRTIFLCLVAKGRESQRRLVEAFEKYQEFAVFAGSEEKITAVDEPAVQAAPDVWVQGRIMALMQGATEQERKPLEQKVQQQWEGLRQNADAATVRRFVAVFGSHFPAGKEARLALVEKLIDMTDADSLLEAERHLLLLMHPRETKDVAARAVDGMARLLTKRGLLDDAAYYYDRLGREYGEVVVSNGRKGADIFNDLATDKRFLPQLDRVVKVGTAPRWKVTEDRAHNPTQGTNYVFDRTGESLPFFDRWQFSLRLDQNELRLEDRLATEDKREVRPLGKVQMPALQNIISQQAQIGQNRRTDQPRLIAQCVGHLAIFQLGYMVYAVDPVSTRPQRILWEKNLVTGAGIIAGAGARGVAPAGVSFTTDPDGTPNILFMEGFTQRLGTPASVDSGILCLQTRDTLVAVDPLTGRVLWTRGDVRSSARVVCEEGLVFVVEMSPTGQPANTRIFRLADGVTVPKAVDFAAVYQKKNRTLGRLVLYLDANPAGGQIARLYDPLVGKDIWEQAYPANSIVLQSIHPHLFGTIAPDGTLTISNLRERKVVLTNKVRMQDFNALLATHLVTDGRDYFVVCNGPVEQRIAAFGGVVQSPIVLNQGMRSLPANGMVYSFNGETGKLRWITRAENQHMILDRFEEMPVVLFAARYQGFGRNQPQQVQQITALETVNKTNGKLLYRNSTDPGDTRSDGLQPLPQGATFFALNLNPAEGKFDFVANNFKLTHRADLEGK